MKNLVLKVGIGLLIGVGSLTLMTPAAHAKPPCTPDSCNVDTCTSCIDSPALFAEEALSGCSHASTLRTGPGTSGQHPACLDCNGSCLGYEFDFHWQDKTCTVACPDSFGSIHIVSSNCQTKWVVFTGWCP